MEEQMTVDEFVEMQQEKILRKVQAGHYSSARMRNIAYDALNAAILGLDSFYEGGGCYARLTAETLQTVSDSVVDDHTLLHAGIIIGAEWEFITKMATEMNNFARSLRNRSN